MKKIYIIALLLLMGKPGILLADYVMLCTMSESTQGRVFSFSDDGDISFLYSLTLTQGGEPQSIEFAPNGKWGMIGCNTTTWPPTQITTILGIDENRLISVLGFVHNEYEKLVAISPNSRYGVYGDNLATLRFYSDNTFYPIPTTNPPTLAQLYADFSKLNNNLYARPSNYIIAEYTLQSDGTTTSTGWTMNINPSYGNTGIYISPDGRTCIVLSATTYVITVFRVNEYGGLSLVQQFDNSARYACVANYTPDSRYAIVSAIISGGGDDMWSYSIGPDSHLTEVDVINLPNAPVGIAITHNGKYGVSRALIGAETYFYVMRIHEDGKLEYLPEKDYVCNGYVYNIAFAPPYKTETEPTWDMYE